MHLLDLCLRHHSIMQPILMEGLVGRDPVHDNNTQRLVFFSDLSPLLRMQRHVSSPALSQIGSR